MAVSANGTLVFGSCKLTWTVFASDQAIQGQGSVRFTEKECQLDRLPFKPLVEGVCKFHVADGVGSNVD